MQQSWVSQEYDIDYFFQSNDQSFKTNDNLFAIGPFARYYLFTWDVRFNFYAQGALQTGEANAASFQVHLGK